MTKQHALIAVLLLAIVSLAATSPALAAENLTNYGWNVLMDNADFYWSFNEAGATDAAQDAARNQPNDQLVAIGGASRAASQTANLGQAASFDGVDSVFHADALVDGSLNGAYAVEFWIQMANYAGTQGAYVMNVMGAGGGDNPGIVYGFNANTIEIYGGGGRTGDSGTTIADANWHHVILANYGNGVDIGVANRADITIDGVTTTVLDSSAQPIMNVQGALNLGRWTDSGGTDFNGKIDELSIYDLSGMTELQIESKLADITDHRNQINNAAAPTLAMVDPAEVTYTVSSSGVPLNTTTYADDTGDELADGIVGSNADSLYEPSLMAFNDPVPENTSYGEVTFDLGSVKDLGAVWIDYMSGGGKWGVKAPESFELSFSEDGVNFSAPIVIDDVNDDSTNGYFHSRRDITELAGVDAQFVKLGVNKVGSFAFLSEVSFIENVNPVPEPSTIILLVGMIAAFGVIRRKR